MINPATIEAGVAERLRHLETRHPAPEFTTAPTAMIPLSKETRFALDAAMGRMEAVAPAPAAKAADKGSLNEAFNWVQGSNPSLARYLRPQSAFQWWTLPYLSAMTPQYIQNLLIGALAGNHVPCWQMFDLMIDSNPEIAACVGEYIDGISEKSLVVEPYHMEDEQPTPRAIENQKIVSAALRNMKPDAANDENALRQTIRDILFSRFHGQSVLNEDWFDTYGTGRMNTLELPKLGTIAAPRCTYWVHPVCYAWDVTGRLGLRVPTEGLKEASKTAKAWQPGTLPTDFGQANGLGYYGAGGATRASAVVDFPKNQFLIAINKYKTGSALGGSCLRSLAWWWCVYNFSGDWLLDLAQLFGIPFRKAKYQQGTPEPEKAEAREMLQNMGSRGWCLLDERVDVEFEKAMDQGASSPQGFLIQLAERQFRKVILRQTMTGQDSSTGKGFGSGELDVKGQCLNAGAQFACEVLREQSARHILMVNRGDDSELPFIRMLNEEEGGLEDAQRDTTLAGGGLPIGRRYMYKKYNIPMPAADEEVIGVPAAPAPAPGSAEAKPEPDLDENGKPKPDKDAESTKDAKEEKPADPEDDSELEAGEGNWITVNGAHILVGDGESADDTIKRTLGDEGKSSPKASKKSGVKIFTNDAGDVVAGPKQMIGHARASAGEYYHGTAPENIDAILKGGINPTDKTLGFKAAFVGKNKGLAQSYGAGSSASKGSKEIALVVVKHDGKGDLFTPNKRETSIGYNPNGIRPEQIDRIEYYSTTGGKDEKPLRVVYPHGQPAEHQASAQEVTDRKSSVVTQSAEALAEMVAPLVKYLRAGLEITEPTAQLHYFQRAVEKWPELTKPILHDSTLLGVITPAMVKTFADGLTTKPAKVEASQLEAGDVEGHDFHGNQYTEIADEKWSGTPKEMRVRAKEIMKGFQPVEHPVLGKVHFSARGRGKTFQDKKTPHEFQSVQAIPELVQKGTLVSSETDREGRASIVAVHTLKRGLKIGETKYQAGIVIRSHKDGSNTTHNFYLHQINHEK